MHWRCPASLFLSLLGVEALSGRRLRCVERNLSRSAALERPKCPRPPGQVFLKELAIFCDYKMDESYTPNKISIRVGATFTDMREVKCVDLTEPQGWVVVPLAPEANPK